MEGKEKGLEESIATQNVAEIFVSGDFTESPWEEEEHAPLVTFRLPPTTMEILWI